MRMEVKVGLIVALGLLVGSMIYYFRAETTETGDIGLEETFQSDPEATARLAGDEQDRGFGHALPRDSGESRARRGTERNRPAVDEPRTTGNRPAVRDDDNDATTPPRRGPEPFANLPETPPARTVEPPPAAQPDDIAIPEIATDDPAPDESDDTTTVTPPPTRRSAAERLIPEVDPNAAAPGNASEPSTEPAADRPPAVRVPERQTRAVDNPSRDAASPATGPPRETNSTSGSDDAGPLRSFEIKRRHVIATGDMLIRIAENEYGDGQLWRAIVRANEDLDPKRMRVGQVVVLPTLSAARRLMAAEAPAASTNIDRSAPPRRATTARGAASASTETRTTRARIYTVARGDTLSSIARNVLSDISRWREIYELNRDQLPNPNTLRVGMELRLPPRNPVDRPDARG